MSLSDYKMSESEANAAGVVSLPDKPSESGMSAAQLKAAFDNLGKNVVGENLNGVIDELVSRGADELVASPNIDRIRLNSDKVIETSADGGENWEASGSSGHLIVNGSGVVMAQRSRLQFLNVEMADNGSATVIKGVQGEQGIQGVQGEKGDTGVQGEKGDRGVVVVPSVSAEGVISWSAQDVANVPPAVNIRGPQGVAGVQGAQGIQGAQGAQGIQGPRGLQGIQGEKGAVGAQGVQGATGAQGPQGPQGIQGLAGSDGRSFVIQDIYATLGALKAAFPMGNEYAYQVSTDKNIYIWSELEADWISLGHLQGPQGPQGIQGVQGPQGLQGEKGDTGDNGVQGIQGIQGETGAQGPQGIQGVQGLDGKSAYTAAVENGYVGTETAFNSSMAQIPSHMANTVAHITATERTAWNGKATTSDVSTALASAKSYTDSAIASAITNAIGGSY